MSDVKITKPKEGHQPKKYTMKLENKIIMKMPKIITIGLEDQQIQLNIAGKVSIEEGLDMLNNTMYEILETFAKSAIAKGADEAIIKKELYERAVWGFSLIIDQFYPEGKDNKYEGFTNEAIMKAQNDLLKKRAKDKK